MKPDGSGQTRVTTDLGLPGVTVDSISGLDDQLGWSSGHQRFYYSGAGTLYSLNTNGTGEAVVAQGVYQFDVSPTGDRVAFWCMSPAWGDIGVMNVDGTGRRLVTGEATRNALGVARDVPIIGRGAWSPDEKRLAFCMGPAMFAVSIDGTEPQRLTPDIWVEGLGGPSWSPDGRYIVFSVANYEAHGWDLQMMDVGTRQISNVIDDGGDPTWSVDGNRIAFQRSDEQIWVINPDGSGLTRLTSVGHNCCPVWVGD